MSRASELADWLDQLDVRAPYNILKAQQSAAELRRLSDIEAQFISACNRIAELVNGNERLEHVNAELVSQWAIEAAARKLAECMDYPWDPMPDRGRDSMREHAESIIRAALTSATKEQQK